MARPRTIKEAVKLNLYVPLSVKRRLFRLASANRRSISSMVAELVLATRPEAPSRSEPLANS